MYSKIYKIENQIAIIFISIKYRTLFLLYYYNFNTNKKCLKNTIEIASLKCFCFR